MTTAGAAYSFTRVNIYIRHERCGQLYICRIIAILLVIYVFITLL